MPHTPTRIVSLTPGSTELLCALGLAGHIVGVDSDSDYPPAVQHLPRVGRGTELDPARITALAPQLVVAYLGAPGMEPLLARLQKAGIATLGLTTRGLSEVMDSIHQAGAALNREPEALSLVAEMGQAVEQVALVAAEATTRPGVYWEWWPKPLVTAGRASWITDMIEMAGGANVFGDLEADSPAIDEDLVIGRSPQVIVACWCGAERMPEPEKIKARRGWELVPAVRESRVHVVEEALYARPGPRLTQGLKHLARLIHPELFEMEGDGR